MSVSTVPGSIDTVVIFGSSTASVSPKDFRAALLAPYAPHAE